MLTRKVHRVLGIILLLPFLGWAVTGFVFFVKPGYSGAYAMLSAKKYPMDAKLRVLPDPAWLEYRCFRTILGDHLLVRTAGGWAHLNPGDKTPRPAPTDAEFGRLLADAFRSDPARYGQVLEVSGSKARTDTGVVVSLDWDSMGLQQRGKDTDRIDLLYRVHYLQWTGVKAVDRVLGGVGLALVLVLSLLGLRLAIPR